MRLPAAARLLVLVAALPVGLAGCSWLIGVSDDPFIVVDPALDTGDAAADGGEDAENAGNAADAEIE